MGGFLFFLFLVVLVGLWIWGARKTSQYRDEADTMLWVATPLSMSEARSVIDVAGKPRNPLTLNKPEWESPTEWTRRFSATRGDQEAEAILNFRLFEEGDPASPDPDHRGGVVAAATINPWNIVTRMGLLYLGTIPKALKIRDKIASRLSQQPAPQIQGEIADSAG